MGITEKPGDSRDRPEPVKVAFGLLLLKDINDALFPPKLGDETKEGDTESEEEAAKRVYDFMRGGRCNEAFTAVEDCAEKVGPVSAKCNELGFRLIECLYAHRDYYQPLLSVFENTEQRLTKDLQAHDDSKRV